MQEPSSGEQGRVGIHVETTSFTVTPGDSVTIPIVLTNHGLEADVLTLAVDGIPSSWVYASSVSTPLNPGQSQQVSLSIQPPRSLQPGKAALILLMEHHWAHPASEAMSDLGGYVFQQTITDRLAKDLAGVTDEE
jgi:hypothetical protein